MGSRKVEEWGTKKAASTVLDTDEPTVLAFREEAVSFLTYSGALIGDLFYKVATVESFLRHLSANKASMLETGYMLTYPGSARYLHHFLGFHYPVKFPGHHRERISEGIVTVQHLWFTEVDGYRVVLTAVNEEGKVFSLEGDWIDPPSYEKAPLDIKLDSRSLYRLLSLREVLFDLKCDVLGVVAECIREGDPESLLQRCLQCIRSRLTAEDIKFFLKMDDMYWYPKNHNLRLEDRELSPLGTTGGLSELLYVIGWFEKELRVGTTTRMAELLHDLIKPDHDGMNRLHIDGYYQIIGKPLQASLDRVLDEFSEKRRLEQEFWGSFNSRVAEAVDKELCGRQTVSADVPSEYAASIRKILDGLAAQADLYKETSSPLPQHLITDRLPDVQVGGPMHSDLVDTLLPDNAEGVVVRPDPSLLVGNLKIMMDDSSVVFNDVKYCLPDKHFQAVSCIVDSQKAGNPWVKKHYVFTESDVPDKTANKVSIRKWFKDAGGDAKRFANRGLIQTGKSGTCRIPVANETIEYVDYFGDGLDSDQN